MTIRIVIVALALSLSPTSLLAQEQENDNFAEHFLEEQGKLWQSPFKIKRGDVKWLAPLSAGAAALLATDRRFSETIRREQDLRAPSRVISKMGGGVVMTAAAATMWTLGRVTGNEKAKRTGKLALEAVTHSELVVAGLKLVTNRERPDKINGEGEFWNGGRSFPSGHSATAWSFATVVAHQYRNKPVVAVGAYGLATAVSLSRLGGLRHFPSDVLIGSSIGYLIGRYVLRHH